jgi:hypothetical protein
MIAFVPGTHHIVFGQDYAHGNPGEETRRFLQTSGASYVALVGSYVGEIHCIDATGACSDAQAVAGGLGDNPSKAIWIVNNYLESSGENILFGGGEATTVPSDITVMNNWLRKPPCWNPNAPNFCSGVKYIVKNHFELKSATRMWVEGNVMEGAWGGFSQSGFSILLTPKSQGYLCAVCEVTDVTIRYNHVKHVGSSFQIANAPPYGVAGERYSIHDNLIEDQDPTYYSGVGSMQVSMGSTDTNGTKSPVLGY